MGRLTFDDLLKTPSESSNFDIETDRKGRPKVVKKKAEPVKELYTNESELKQVGIEFLKALPRCKVLLTDNMAFRVGNGRKTKTRNPGMSDHHICIRGLFVAIEAKMLGKNLDPDQKIYRDEVLQAGGIFIVYHSRSELISEMKRHKLISVNYE